MKTIKNPKFQRMAVLSSMILAVAMTRLLMIPIPNFAPIGAMALFGAAYFQRQWLGLLVPLAALLLTDFLLEAMTGYGFYSGMLFVYGSFVLIWAIGLRLRHSLSVKSLALAVLSSSVLFFLISNFGAWLGSPYYPQNLSGLAAAYAAGLAFFQGNAIGSPFLNTLAGNLFFSALLFGSFEWVSRSFPALRQTA